MPEKIIRLKRSVIVAADVPTISDLQDLTVAMNGVPGISGFKIGLTLAMNGLRTVTSTIKCLLGPHFPVIYDHQKAGNDIPAMGNPFARALASAGVDAAILFPFAGPVTQEAWTKACFDAGLHVIVGGVMTHEKFLVSEGGYIADEAVEQIYRTACRMGVTNFVVPGTKIEWVKKIRSWLVEELGEGNFILFAPGFVKQKGIISECGEAAGDEWHAIVGSGIYMKNGITAQREAAYELTEQIVA